MLESEILSIISLTRRKKGISQKEMASILGISPSAYSKFESGKGSITLERVISVLNQLDLELVCPTNGESVLQKNSTLLEKISALLKENQRILSIIHKNTNS